MFLVAAALKHHLPFANMTTHMPVANCISFGAQLANFMSAPNSEGQGNTVPVLATALGGVP